MSQIKKEKMERLNFEAEEIIGLSKKFFSSISIKTENQKISNGSRIPLIDGGYMITEPTYFKIYSWGKLSTDISGMQVELLKKYDFWYEKSRFIIKTFLSERLEAFNESYEEGRKYINLDNQPSISASNDIFYDNFRKCFNIGQNILLLVSSVDITEFDAIEKNEKSNSKNLHFDNVGGDIFMNNVFKIDSQTAGRDIYNIAGDLNITQNSPPEDVLKLIQAIQQKVSGLEIGEKDKKKISNHLDNVRIELEEQEPDKKSIEESIKSANGILKEAKATGETLKDIGVMVLKAAKWLGTTAAALGWIFS